MCIASVTVYDVTMHCVTQHIVTQLVCMHVRLCTGGWDDAGKGMGTGVRTQRGSRPGQGAGDTGSTKKWVGTAGQGGRGTGRIIGWQAPDLRNQ